MVNLRDGNWTVYEFFSWSITSYHEMKLRYQFARLRDKCLHTYMEILLLTEFACHIKKWMIMLILLEATVPAKIVFSFLLLKIVM